MAFDITSRRSAVGEGAATSPLMSDTPLAVKAPSQCPCRGRPMALYHWVRYRCLWTTLSQSAIQARVACWVGLFNVCRLGWKWGVKQQLLSKSSRSCLRLQAEERDHRYTVAHPRHGHRIFHPVALAAFCTCVLAKEKRDAAMMEDRRRSFDNEPVKLNQIV